MYNIYKPNDNYIVYGDVNIESPVNNNDSKKVT